MNMWSCCDCYSESSSSKCHSFEHTILVQFLEWETSDPNTGYELALNVRYCWHVLKRHAWG